MGNVSFTPVIVAGMMLAAASPLFAQKHGNSAPHPMPSGQMTTPVMPKEAGTAKQMEHEHHEHREARKDHAEGLKEHEKTVKAADKIEDRTAHDAAESAKRADKVEDRGLRHAFDDARHQDKGLTHGARLTSPQRTKLREIDRRYDTQLRALEKEMDASEKEGRVNDPALLTRVNALRDQERTDLRAVLTPAQQTVFDRNVSRLNSRH